MVPHLSTAFPLSVCVCHGTCIFLFCCFAVASCGVPLTCTALILHSITSVVKRDELQAFGIVSSFKRNRNNITLPFLWRCRPSRDGALLCDEHIIPNQLYNPLSSDPRPPTPNSKTFRCILSMASLITIGCSVRLEGNSKLRIARRYTTTVFCLKTHRDPRRSLRQSKGSRL